MALTPTDIGKRIQEAREQKHWTQMKFAQEANVSISSVSRWENGKLPPVRELIRLADVLDVEPEYFVELPAEEPDSEVVERLDRIERILESLVAQAESGAPEAPPDVDHPTNRGSASA